ncbi:Zinc finger protein MAGPIE [Platanthera zijinensis]|uniref:Zinc finger protein MAGPIE n=1 Tax=Platanthera zijinensis TaxID=2320716 RepID=A0AAP0BS01_9ASPA
MFPSEEATTASSSHNNQKKKKKRSQPGTPDPAAEVVAMSPRSLMATNRFVCEICGKGFQREQNLQLHMRGHNLPWRLRSSKDQAADQKKQLAVRPVYVCPEPSCVHHHPSRALGDLTGVKKHYCRKHGEKRWSCDKCSKKYAVFSDWKAHDKTCGSREYTCHCGTLFSRKDSFITHRAFCDALAEESARIMAHSKPAANDIPTAPLLHHPLFGYSSNPNPNTDPKTTSTFEPTPGVVPFQPLFIPYFSGHHLQHSAAATPQLSATTLLQRATSMGHLRSTIGRSFDLHASTSQSIDGTRNFLDAPSGDELLPLPVLGMDEVTPSPERWPHHARR